MPEYLHCGKLEKSCGIYCQSQSSGSVDINDADVKVRKYIKDWRATNDIFISDQK